MSKRVIYNLLFGFFAVIVPLAVFNYKYPFQQLITKEATEAAQKYSATFAGILAALILVFFFRKQLYGWVTSFDRVGPLKGLGIWIKFSIPSGIVFFIAFALNSLGPNAVFILGGTFLSHMIAGVFKALALKEKAENFKNWVLN